MTQIPDNLPAGTTHFCPAFGRYPDRAMQLRRGDNWAYWTGFSWFEVQCGPPPSVRREMIDVREQAQWNGEGLPPVGLEVEVFSIAKPHHSYEAHVGQRVRIVAHDILGEGDDEGTPVAVYAFNLSTGTGYHALIAGHFRPIRTAEQIAAEEREWHRAKYVGELNKLWDADTKRSEFIESVYALIVEAGAK